MFNQTNIHLLEKSSTATQDGRQHLTWPKSHYKSNYRCFDKDSLANQNSFELSNTKTSISEQLTPITYQPCLWQLHPKSTQPCPSDSMALQLAILEHNMIT